MLECKVFSHKMLPKQPMKQMCQAGSSRLAFSPARKDFQSNKYFMWANIQTFDSHTCSSTGQQWIIICEASAHPLQVIECQANRAGLDQLKSWKRNLKIVHKTGLGFHVPFAHLLTSSCSLHKFHPLWRLLAEYISDGLEIADSHCSGAGGDIWSTGRLLGCIS